MENNSKNMEKNSNNTEQKLNTMEQSSTLSKEAQEVIINFVEKDNLIDIGNSLKLLIVSLYAMQPYVNKEVLEALQQYNNDLGSYLSSDQISILRQEYSEVIKYCAYNEGGIPSQLMSMRDYDNVPNFVVELCMKMAAPTPGTDILLANSGLAEFSLGYNSFNYYGYESSPEIWAWSQILIDAFDVNADLKNCNYSDFVANPPKQYDYIFYSLSRFQRDNNIFQELLSLAKCSLKENGQMYCRIPYSFTFRRDCDQYREDLMKKPCEFEVKVISIPPIKGLRTLVGECVLCLTKNHTGKVTILDGKKSDFVEKYCDTSSHIPMCEVDDLLKALGESNGKFIWHGEASDLNKNYELTLAPYTAEYYQPIPEKDEELMEMGELVDIIDCKRIFHSDEDKQYPTISRKNLSPDYLRCNDIELDKLEKSSNGIPRLLSSDALLFGVRRELRVAKWFGGDKIVGLGFGIIPMRLKSKDVIMEDFLLRALTLKETFQQVKLYARVLPIIYLSKDDFLKIKIAVPSLERQKEICLKDLRDNLSEMDLKLLSEQKDFRRDIHMKIHTIGQTVGNIDNILYALQIMRERGNGTMNDSDIYGVKNPKSVAMIYEDLRKTVERLKDQINSFDRGYNKTPKVFALTEFVEWYIKSHQNPIFTYEYDVEKHHYQVLANLGNVEEQYFEHNENLNGEKSEPIYKEGDPKEWINFPWDALDIIFDNIISNACAHGFSGREAGDNKIKIDIENEGTYYVITIANNGIPLHPQLTEKKVFTYGVTSQAGKKHSGIGGHEVYELMREFGGKVELISTPDEEFTISYRLTFIDTNIETKF